MAQNMKGCQVLNNIPFKAYALHNNQHGKEFGCLQCQENLCSLLVSTHAQDVGIVWCFKTFLVLCKEF